MNQYVCAHCGYIVCFDATHASVTPQTIEQEARTIQQTIAHAMAYEGMHACIARCTKELDAINDSNIHHVFEYGWTTEQFVQACVESAISSRVRFYSGVRAGLLSIRDEWIEKLRKL